MNYLDKKLAWVRSFVNDPFRYGRLQLPDYPLLPPYPPPPPLVSPPPKIIVMKGTTVKNKIVKKPKEKILS